MNDVTEKVTNTSEKVFVNVVISNLTGIIAVRFRLSFISFFFAFLIAQFFGITLSEKLSAICKD